MTTTDEPGSSLGSAPMTRWVKRSVPVLSVVLFAAFPVLSLYAQNRTEVELSLLWPAVAVCVVAALVLFGLFLSITKDAAKAGVLSTMVVVAFLYYGVFVDQGSRWFLALWLVVLVVGVVAVLRTSRDVFNIALLLGVAAAVMVVPQAITVARYRADTTLPSADDPSLWPTALATPVVEPGTTLPDIYVLSPDDYARSDILKQYFDYDDSEFLAQLEQRGFVIADENRSPYSFSEMNEAAMLNRDYLSNWPDVLSPTSQDFNLVKRVAEDNRAARLLTSIGYDYIHLDTDEVTFSGGNPGISPFAAPDSFSNLWLPKSILGQLGGPLGFDDAAINERFRKSIHSEFSELRSIPAGSDPKFVVFHTLIPHDPFIFGAGGESVTFPADADHTKEIGMEYYVEQLQYVQKQLLDSIDQILEDAESPPVIVLQADEGFEVDEALFGEAATRDIRVKGIGAYHLPGLDPSAQPDPPNIVNALRFVFNEYLGTDYEMLGSVSHLESDYPFTFEEIPVE
jgi:hypothetical protein